MPSQANRYGFRVFDKNKVLLREHILTINPQDLFHGEPVKATPVETFGGAYLDDAGRAAITMMTIAGHTGYSPKESYLSGQNEFLRLRSEIFRRQDEANVALIVFDNYTDEEHYIVKILNFSLRKNTSKPILYEYNIQMVTLGKYESEFFKFVDKIANAFYNMQEYLRGISDRIRNVQQRIVGNMNRMTDAVKGTIYSLNNSIDILIVGTTSALNTVASDIQSIMQIPLEETRFASKLCETAKLQIDSALKKVTNPVDRYYLIETQNDVLIAKRDIDSLTALKQSFAVTVLNATAQAKQTYVVMSGESLQDIAVKQLGDFERWTEIAEANNIKPDEVLNLTGRVLIMPSQGIETESQNLVSTTTIDEAKNLLLWNPEKSETVNKQTGNSSQIALKDTNNSDVVKLTSVGNGEYTNDIKVKVEPGTLRGVKVTIQFVNITEQGDNIGSDVAQTAAMVNWINQNSRLVKAERVGIGSDLVNPVPFSAMSGGSNPSIDTMSITQDDITKLIFGEDLDKQMMASSNGTIVTIKGPGNVKQALENKILISVNELSPHPNFGTIIRDLIGQPGETVNIGKIKVDVNRMLAMDERVKEVISISVKQSGQKSEIKADVLLKDNYTLSVIVPA